MVQCGSVISFHIALGKENQYSTSVSKNVISSSVSNYCIHNIFAHCTSMPITRDFILNNVFKKGVYLGMLANVEIVYKNVYSGSL